MTPPLRRHGQPVLHGAGGLGVGVEDTQRERRRCRKRGRGDAQQTPDSVSEDPTFFLFILNHKYEFFLVLSSSQSSLHHPPGGVRVVRSLCHGHLLRSGLQLVFSSKISQFSGQEETK